MILSELTPPLARFGLIDWLVVAGYLLLTTIIGAALSGRPSTIRDFFLGGLQASLVGDLRVHYRDRDLRRHDCRRPDDQLRAPAGT